MITAVVGAGGKTSLIRQLAAEERAAGRSVLVTTTTHMFIEGDTLCTGDPQPILTRLRETGYAMAGIPQGPKITALPPETYEILCREAHTVLVEADGSRHMALKFPGPGEPVIPENADRILVVRYVLSILGVISSIYPYSHFLGHDRYVCSCDTDTIPSGVCVSSSNKYLVFFIQ